METGKKTPQIFIVFGRGGSGKGTQTDLLVKKFNLIYIGSGDLLRQRKNENDFTAAKIDDFMSKGELAPTSLVFMLWINKLEEMKNINGDDFPGIIFDGSPRKLIEAKLLKEALEWYDWDKNIRILLIDISRQEAFDRLAKRRMCQKCGKIIPYVGEYKNLKSCDACGGELVVRLDDTPEGINKRLNWYEEEVLPVMEFLEKDYPIIKINGEQSIEDVHKEIMEKIK